MATEFKIRRPGKWLTVIPSPEIVRKRIAELQEELRQFRILLTTAEHLESTQPEHASEVLNQVLPSELEVKQAIDVLLRQLSTLRAVAKTLQQSNRVIQYPELFRDKQAASSDDEKCNETE